MKVTILSTTSVALFALPTKVLAMLENTADVCTANISNLKFLRPSECDPTGRVGPDITVGSTVYNNDEAHFVIGSPKTAEASELSLARELMKPKYLRHAKKRGEAPRARKDSIVVYLPGEHLSYIFLLLAAYQSLNSCPTTHHTPNRNHRLACTLILLASICSFQRYANHWIDLRISQQR